MRFSSRNYQQAQQLSERQLQERKYTSARSYLLLMLIITVVNILLLIGKNDFYFFFTAFVPWLLVVIGMSNCGMFPEEFYGEGYESAMFLDESFFVIMLVIAIVLLVPYLLCWLMSKKGKSGWLIFALVWYGLDTALMLINGISSDMIFGYVLHALMLYYLYTGVTAAKKLKTLPADPVEVFDVEPVAGEPVEE